MKTFSDHCTCGKESNLVESNVYRVGSEKYFEYWRNIREEYYAAVMLWWKHTRSILSNLI